MQLRCGRLGVENTDAEKGRRGESLDYAQGGLPPCRAYEVTRSCGCIRRPLTPPCAFSKSRSDFRRKSGSQWSIRYAKPRDLSAPILAKHGASVAIQLISSAS